PEQVRERQQIRRQIASIEKTLKVLDTTSPAKQSAWEKRFATDAPKSIPAEIRTILYIPRHQRSAQQQRTLDQAFHNADRARHAIGGLGNPLLVGSAVHFHASSIRTRLENRIDMLEASLPKIPTTLVMQERSVPRKTYVHLAGDFLRKGAEVQPAVPAV